MADRGARDQTGNRLDYEPPNELNLTNALEKLRAHDGLTLARLQACATSAAAPLLRLSAVQRYAMRSDIGLPEAALAVVTECVREGLSGSSQCVADTVLGLRIAEDCYLEHGIDPRVVQALYGDLLGRRRRTLLAHWGPLHEALASKPPETPGDRLLRSTTEPLVLAQLAGQLVRREKYSIGAKSALARGPGDAATPRSAAEGGQPKRVVVVGGAVMDATFRTKSFPQPQTSGEAHGFTLAPGGKGLTQAIAAARLGLDTSLLAAVGDDRFGQEILDYLRRERVDTSLVKVVRDARTAFTGVIELELGDSMAVNWRNEREVRLDIRDIEHCAVELSDCDAMLITFEVPRESMQRAVDLVHTSVARDPRPTIVVTPGQPYETDGSVSGATLSQIDYLVAMPWEIGRYAPDLGVFDLDAVARRLLAYGVETLCVPTSGGCAIYSESLGTFSVPTFPSQYKESSAARDAFCAALAARLADQGGKLTEQAALWATAAMAAAMADFPLPNSMPDRGRIDRMLSRSRFIVAPRSENDGRTGAAAEPR